MKAEIHPNYHKKAKVTCACGNSFEVGSTSDKLEVEVCSQCHPFYTGQEKVMDRAGRVERFKARRNVAEEQQKKEEQRVKEKKQKKEKAAKAKAEEEEKKIKKANKK